MWFVNSPTLTSLKYIAAAYLIIKHQMFIGYTIFALVPAPRVDSIGIGISYKISPRSVNQSEVGFIIFDPVTRKI